jgi:hypothetical protein
MSLRGDASALRKTSLLSSPSGLGRCHQKLSDNRCESGTELAGLPEADERVTQC